MSIKNDLQQLGEQFASMTPNELFMSLHPGLDRLMQTPMDGGVAHIVGKNFISATNAANRVNKKRKEKLKEYAEMDEKDNVKFLPAETGQEPVPDFKTREGKEEFMKWDTNMMTNNEVEFRIHKIHVDRLSGIQDISPMVLVMVKEIIFDPTAEEAVSQAEIEKETA